jgi:putative sterol carrier protein
MRFLSSEWATAVEQACNDDPTFREAAAGHDVKIQQVITGADGEIHYWTTLQDGRIGMGVGDVEAPDATIRQSYDTAAGLARKEVNAVTAFMTGKIKVDGNMGQLMALQPVLGKLADAMRSLDVDY